MKAVITVRAMTALERVPQMPGLLDHLQSMSGGMARISTNVTARPRSEESVQKRSQIKRMLDSGMNACRIADETGIPRGTVYWYIKEIKAAA